MPATTNRVICPICRKPIRQAAERPVMLPHTDKTDKTCPMSGQAIGPTDKTPRK